MKIFLVSPHYPPRFIGGTEKMAHRLARSFTARGHSVEVAAVDSVGTQEEALLCQTEVEDGVTVHRLHLNERNLVRPLGLNFCNTAIQQWFREHIRSDRPDVVHLLSGYLTTGCVLDAAFEADIPSVITLVDFWMMCPLITLLRSDGQLCSEPVEPARCVWCLRALQRRYRLVDQWLGGLPGAFFTYLGKTGMLGKHPGYREEERWIRQRREFNRRLLQKVDVVITQSRFFEEKLKEYDMLPRRMIYAPYGLEKSNHREGSGSQGKSEKFRIGYLGQIAAHKGVHVLVEAYRLLNLPPGRAELRLYGDLGTWPSYVRSLRTLARGREDVLFLGPFPGHEIGRIMDECDVIVTPSIWYENHPTVILEAFDHGKPVIASDLGGMIEMVRHGVDGFLFEAGNPRSLAEQLRKLIEDPFLYERLRAGIQPVRRLDEEVTDLELLYMELVESRRG
ncbi:glycosyltransferase [Anaerolinea thermolimosa]|uniref:Glycosyltransferase n=1 Tax=Anaerolinea thermolimosa TaxID=229919 RepID=A0A7U9KMJ1_9CHLR|nr:glycosyltransferase family 4 protein [Anaerolinea thermolimosa]GAP08604.1 glycosyltransferase [Anaerolinea thermolimosa]